MIKGIYLGSNMDVDFGELEDKGCTDVFGNAAKGLVEDYAGTKTLTETWLKRIETTNLRFHAVNNPQSGLNASITAYDIAEVDYQNSLCDKIMRLCEETDISGFMVDDFNYWRYYNPDNSLEEENMLVDFAIKLKNCVKEASFGLTCSSAVNHRDGYGCKLERIAPHFDFVMIESYLGVAPGINTYSDFKSNIYLNREHATSSEILAGISSVILLNGSEKTKSINDISLESKIALLAKARGYVIFKYLPNLEFPSSFRTSCAVRTRVNRKLKDNLTSL